MSIAQIVVVCDPDKFSAKVQAWGEDKFGKGSHPARPYHLAWLKDGCMFDMHFNFREIPKDYYKKRKCLYFDSPVDVSLEYLRSMVGKRKYGYLDVALYPIFQVTGLNWLGTHCSEAINDDLWFHSYRTPFIPYGTPPDPARMLYWLESLKGS